MATQAEFARIREMADQALSWSGEGDIEMEAALKTNVTPFEFSRLTAAVIAFPGASPPVETVQLDCLGAARRWQFESEDRIRAFMRRGSSVGPAADRVLEKKNVASVVKLSEFPFVVRLKSERTLPSKGAIVPSADSLRMRLKRRLSVTFESAGVRVDMTAVMEGTGELRRVRSHEVEVEALIGPDTKQNGAEALAKTVMGYIKACYCALRGTTAPVSETERARFLSAYDGLTGESSTTKFSLVGPNPVTLTRANVQPPGPGVVTVLDGYTVTDKADGERCLMLLTDGAAVLLDSRGNITRAFTGVPKSLDGTLLDGELVTTSKLLDQPLRLFAAFDAYWVSGRSVSALPLMSRDSGAKTRLRAAKGVVDEVNKRCEAVDGMSFELKEFSMLVGQDYSKTVKEAFTRAEAKPYENDGLIFTPAAGAVGSAHDGDPVVLKNRWARALKWKPPSYNSVDFLVRVKLDKVTGAETIRTRQTTLPNGAAVTLRSKVVQLMAGYEPGKYQEIDAVDYLTRGSAALPRKGLYVAKTFEAPGEPDIGEIALDVVEGRMVCDDGETLEDDTVVEFSFAEGVGWQPMRVRHDKTENYVTLGDVTANSWETAQSVYSSIKYPVTHAMIVGDEPTPPPPEDTGVYFTEEKNKDSKEMRDFHNLVVKAELYKKYGVKGGALLEMACGRGGDINRWIAAGFSLIVGIDKARNEIVGPKGVYARWDSSTSKVVGRARAAFITMDTTVRMFAPHDELKAAAAEADQTDLVATMWGLPGTTRPALEPFKGVMTRGFDLVACQFAVHYMFETPAKLDRFIANVARMTRSGGHFVGTTFDGDLVMAGMGSSGKMRGRVGQRDMWTISRAFEGRFAGECGKAIDVYIASIGAPYREYLVSFRTLEARMKAAGFVLAETELFKDVYARAVATKTLPNPVPQVDRDLSFLYRTFAFKKK